MLRGAPIQSCNHARHIKRLKGLRTLSARFFSPKSPIWRTIHLAPQDTRLEDVAGNRHITAMNTIKNVCVYCGSGPGTNPEFVNAATAFGRTLAENDVGLVYGGGSVGLMGAVAAGALAHNGKVTGIIPTFLTRREHVLKEAQEVIITKDMHERKQLMFEHSDAFVAFPGGVGTLEELVEQMTWSQLGRHNKPILLANIDGFWNPLLVLIDHMKRTEFIRANLWVDVLTADKVEDILPKLRAEAAKTSADAKLMDDRVASGL